MSAEDSYKINEDLDNFLKNILSLQEIQCDSYLIHQSYQAVLASNAESWMDCQNADSINGIIIMDSESEDAEIWTKAATVEAEKQKVVEKQRVIMRQKLRRQVKHVADVFVEKSFKKVRGLIIKKFPNTGKNIETLVTEWNVGVDYWRRTGILTFDGNCNVKEKVTYNRIREHLQQFYGCHFSYGTIVCGQEQEEEKCKKLSWSG